MQSCNAYINVHNSKGNKPSSKILASTQNQSQEMIDKFMRKRKSKYKKKTEQERRNEPTKNIPRECLVVSEKIGKDRLTEITELLRLEHLSFQEKQM